MHETYIDERQPYSTSTTCLVNLHLQLFDHFQEENQGNFCLCCEQLYTTVGKAGPWLPAACATKTPAPRANNMKTSHTLKNGIESSGSSAGPTESVNMSADPSIVACAT